MAGTMINRIGMALLLAVVYAFFAIQATRHLIHLSGGQSSISMPIVMTMAYVFCAYFFWEIQRRTSNVFEKTMAWASGGVFVLRLLRLVGVEFHVVSPWRLLALSYAVPVLIGIATLAIIGRTLQLFMKRKLSSASAASDEQL